MVLMQGDSSKYLYINTQKSPLALKPYAYAKLVRSLTLGLVLFTLQCNYFEIIENATSRETEFPLVDPQFVYKLKSPIYELKILVVFRNFVEK